MKKTTSKVASYALCAILTLGSGCDGITRFANKHFGSTPAPTRNIYGETTYRPTAETEEPEYFRLSHLERKEEENHAEYSFDSDNYNIRITTGQNNATETALDFLILKIQEDLTAIEKESDIQQILNYISQGDGTINQLDIAKYRNQSNYAQLIRTTARIIGTNTPERYED